MDLLSNDRNGQELGRLMATAQETVDLALNNDNKTYNIVYRSKEMLICKFRNLIRFGGVINGSYVTMATFNLKYMPITYIKNAVGSIVYDFFCNE